MSDGCLIDPSHFKHNTVSGLLSRYHSPLNLGRMADSKDLTRQRLAESLSACGMVFPEQLAELVQQAGLVRRAVLLCVMESQHTGRPVTFVQPALACKALQAFCGPALASKGVRDDTVALARVLPRPLRGAFIAVPHSVWKAQVELTAGIKIERWCLRNRDAVPMVLHCGAGSAPAQATLMLLAGSGAWLGKTPLSKEEKTHLYYAMGEKPQKGEMDKEFFQRIGFDESACGGHPAYQRLRRDLEQEDAAFFQRPDVRRARCLGLCGGPISEFSELLCQHHLDFVTRHRGELEELRKYIKEEDQKETRQEARRKDAARRAKAEAYAERCWQIAARPCTKCGRPQPPCGYLCECLRIGTLHIKPTAASGGDEAAGGADKQTDEKAKADVVRGCKFQTRRRGKNLQANLPEMRS